MSGFAKLMTMKLIELERAERCHEAGHLPFWLMQSNDDLVRNLNVRVPVTLIAQIEVLASFLNLSKAELVTEILESSLDEAIEMLKKDGRGDIFLEKCIERLRDQYGVNIERKEESKNE